MRYLNYCAAILILTTSCTAVQQIGKVNMISNRNVDTGFEYSVISTYAGGSNAELKKSKATSIEDAIDQTVRNVPGGEFIMNARIYLIKEKYFAVEGDVWGQKNNANHRGFSIGDKVTWKEWGNHKTGTVKAFKDTEKCILDVDGGGTTEKKYDDLNKTE